MKIPYIKIYTADLLAVSRHATYEEIGRAVVGICEKAFGYADTYQPQTKNESTLFALLDEWKQESAAALKQKRLAGKKGGLARQQKLTLSDGSTACFSASSTPLKHTETETDTETETKYIFTVASQQDTKESASLPPAGASPTTQNLTTLTHPKPKEKPQPTAPKRTLLQDFSNEVLKNFEPDVQTDAQKQVWFKRNCRCLTDILNFCNKDIDVAIATVYACFSRLEKANLKGGYEAVCRNLPQYFSEAQKLLQLPGEAPREAQQSGPTINATPNTTPRTTPRAVFYNSPLRTTVQAPDAVREIRAQQEAHAKEEAYAALVAHAKARGMERLPTRADIF